MKIKKYFYDSETVSLNGPAVILQYAIDDGPIIIHDIWTNPIIDTLKLIDEMMENCVIAFNISFDHFQLCKIYTMFSLYLERTGDNAYPEDIIQELALLEPEARDGKCLKPKSCFDVMLHARKGPYQSTMDRHDVIIKKVPTQLAWQLCAELENRIKLPDIYFARKKDHSAQWRVDDIEDDDGQIDPNWKNISLRFNPSSALKALAVDALKLEKDHTLLFADISINKKFVPQDKKLGYAPFALAHSKKKSDGSIDWDGTWPEVIRHHIDHWLYHKLARKYACDDVDYLRRLYEYFGKPPVDDDDSTLACMVASCRWRGFKVDLKKINELRIKAQNANKKKIKKVISGHEVEVNFDIPTAPRPVLHYITELMDETEKLGFETNNGKSTKKIILESLASWEKECNCAKDGIYDESCEKCQGKGIIRHPVALRAKEVLDARMSNYEVDFYDKLILAGRLHADLNIIGALSGRMSGASGINVQGVKKSKEVRSCFPFAWENQILCGGDFSSFEVTLAEASYNDPDLRKDLLTCETCEGQMKFFKGLNRYEEILNFEAYLKFREQYEKKNKVAPREFENDFICTSCGSNEGKAIHALFGVFVFPEHDYWSLKKTKGTSDDKYTRAKSGVFALMYGGTEFTLEERLGVPSEVAIEARAKFYRRYPGVARSQKRIIDSFQSMKQPGGIGTKIIWHEPKEYIESLFGFRRYFILENQICKTLFELANRPPSGWKDIKIKVQRRDRIQTGSGAVQSALFAAAFNLQSSNTRAAVNHEIQASGAQVTKFVQRKIWDLQPHGINDFIVELLNVHDEIMAPCSKDKDIPLKIKEIVNNAVESFREKVPLIKLEWVIGLKDWSEK